MKLTVIDYGIGNIGSILNMLNRIGIKANYTSDKSKIADADKLILPGVGAFDTGMNNLRQSGLIPLLEEKVMQNSTPVLGICLGMQLLFEKSEEGSESGLGWLKGQCVRFQLNENHKHLRVPHMGWNSVKPTNYQSLYHTLEQEPRFYFVHSFHVHCDDPNDVLSTTDYGSTFVSSVNRKNIYGVQFHPEKSHRFGMTVLKNFVERVQQC